MKITTIGIDLAKNVMQAKAQGAAALSRHPGFPHLGRGQAAPGRVGADPMLFKSPLGVEVFPAPGALAVVLAEFPRRSQGVFVTLR
jgi:hypothetical protein